MAEVNQDCICFPKKDALCKESPDETLVVCRSDDLVLNVGGTASVNTKCDECRICMSDTCFNEGFGSGNFTSVESVETTLLSWDGKDCRGDACADKCAYNPNTP